MTHEYAVGASKGAGSSEADHPPKRRSPGRLILLAALAGALAIGLALFVRAGYVVETGETTLKPMADAPRAPAVDGVGALGRIEPRSRLIRLSNEAAMTGGIVGKILVREGQSVKAGDQIAVLTDWKRRKAEVALAEAEISAAKARLLAAEAELESAQRDSNRKKSLFKSGSATLTALDGVELRVKKAKADVSVATASVQQSEANLQLKQELLSQAASTAPIDGVILKINARPGERIGPEGLADIADLDQLDVVAEVYEADIPRVSVGQKAVVNLPERNAPYSAEVREIAFLVRKNHVNDTDPLADRDNKIVEVRMTLDPSAITALRHQLFRQVQVRIEK